MNPAEHVWQDLDAPRAPSEHERRVLATLAEAVSEPLLQDQVSSVVIDAVCRCGCSSVRLRSDRAVIPSDRVSELSSRRRPDYLAVESSGRGQDNHDINVLLHVVGGQVRELEIFDSIKGAGTTVELECLTRLTAPTIY